MLKLNGHNFDPHTGVCLNCGKQLVQAQGKKCKPVKPPDPRDTSFDLDGPCPNPRRGARIGARHEVYIRDGVTFCKACGAGYVPSEPDIRELSAADRKIYASNRKAATKPKPDPRAAALDLAEKALEDIADGDGDADVIAQRALAAIAKVRGGA